MLVITSFFSQATKNGVTAVLSPRKLTGLLVLSSCQAPSPEAIHWRRQRWSSQRSSPPRVPPRCSEEQQHKQHVLGMYWTSCAVFLNNRHIRPLLKSLRYSQPNTFRLGKISLNSKNFRVGQSPSMSCQLSYRPWGITTFISVPRTPKRCLPCGFFWVLPTAQQIQLTRFRRTCLEMESGIESKKNDDHNHNHKLNGRLFHVQFNYYSSSDQCAIPRRFWNLNHIDEATLGGEFPCQTKGWDQWRLIMGSWLKMNRFLFDC